MEAFPCVIIEDEPLAMERTRAFVEKVPFLHLVASFDNALTGLSYLRNHQVDVLFLDINMDELSGVELLESTPFPGQVIITTAFPEYALKGYELSVTDYLLKPFSFTRFLQAANKAREQLVSSQPREQDFIFVKTEHRLEKIFVDDILYIEGMRDYLRIHTSEKKIMTLQKFGDLAAQFSPNRVCRVHKSYMVGLAKIEAVERSRIIIGDQRIPISDTYRKAFFALIGGS